MIPIRLVTLDYIKNSNTIFGPNIPSIKGKMARQKPKPVVSNYINIPKDILHLKKTVSVLEEIMFVNGMEFLVSTYRHVKFTTVKYLGKRMTSNIYKSLENINDVYYRFQIYVDTFYIYREFENTRRLMIGISTLNTIAAAEHVTEI